MVNLLRLSIFYGINILTPRRQGFDGKHTAYFRSQGLNYVRKFSIYVQLMIAENKG